MRVLVAVITGGRPSLAMRPTRKHFPALLAAGFTDIEWVVRDDQAPGYEADEYPLNVYPLTWAGDYARSHWRHPTATWEAGGFYGAAPGREWAMRTAEARGFDAVLQLDDNVTHIGLVDANQPAYRSATDTGQMMRWLAELSASTNVSMLGAQLNSVVPMGKIAMVRVGYPYSCFIEKCGPTREPYYGPFEDDIMHALEYGLYGGAGRTAGLVPLMRYRKESKSKTGMRKHYDAGRGLEIARRYPNNVTLRVGPKTSATNDTARGVRHYLKTKGFAPIRVLDTDRFIAADRAVREAVRLAQRNKVAWDKDKMRQRARA